MVLGFLFKNLLTNASECVCECVFVSCLCVSMYVVFLCGMFVWVLSVSVNPYMVTR